jgi:ABC-2 type transport system ATP-binding protein
MHKQEPLVLVKNIHKEFIMSPSRNSSLKQSLIKIINRKGEKIQKVLDGVDFEINKGDFFGIVGRNGSGKSTLLKLIAGVYTPTKGHIELRGGLTPFIELGVGFNPELSGRDNVYLNGALLGYSRKEINDIYDEIVEFAELGNFMDQKLKNYSSGMQVRLAFSIAVKARNDILIFDEVLAVGDEAFQQKCLEVFERYKAEGQTVILVTHDMNNVRRFCNKALLLEGGKIKSIGNPQNVSTLYSKSNEDSLASELENQSTDQNAIKTYTIVRLDKIGKNKVYSTGENINVSVDISKIPKEVNVESVGVSIFKMTGEHITGENSRYYPAIKRNVSVKAKLNISYELTLRPGRYYVYVEIFTKPGSRFEDIHHGLEFIIKGDNELEWSGLTRLKHEWSLGKHES